MKAKTIIHLKGAHAVPVAEALSVVRSARKRGRLIRVTALVDGQPRNRVLDSTGIKRLEHV